MKYFRRFAWYIASRLLIFALAISIIVIVFYVSMNAANIYILMSDGMETRTHVVLSQQDYEELYSFFSDSFLAQDETLQVGMSLESPYANYSISSFESELSMEWIWTWPWENTAQSIITHKVTDIKGSVKSSKKSLLENGVITNTPPSWQGGRYRVSLQKQDGQWKIASMVQTQVLLNTPAPKAS